VRTVVIDDIGYAVRLLAPVGQVVGTEPAYTVREAVLRFARAKGWVAVEYSEFVRWARRIANDGNSWLVIDRLFPRDGFGDRAVGVGLTRTLTPDGWGVAADDCTIDGDGLVTASTGIIDDAAASGVTLTVAVNLLQSSGADPAKVVLCCASEVARRTVEMLVPGVEWHQFVTGDTRVIHLRDACSWLPYSGRAISARSAFATGAESLTLRMHMRGVPGGLWPEILSDAQLSSVVAIAHSDFVRRLSTHLDRDSTVGDCSHVGPSVAVRPELCGNVSTTMKLKDALLL
jgi:hypothetical protein